MQFKHFALVAATALLSTVSITTAASASPWEERHPR